jgi:DNA-binding NarL/FixJ family response regulator
MRHPLASLSAGARAAVVSLPGVALLTMTLIAVGFLHPDATDAPLILLVVPIAMVGWRWGPRAGIGAAILVMAVLGARNWIADLDMGAVGYLTRAAAYATVIVLAAAGQEQRQSAGNGAAMVTSRAPGLGPFPQHGLLTGRELEVLEMMAEGATNAQIADSLFISASTVQSHVKAILRKLGVSNRTQAVSVYFRR